MDRLGLMTFVPLSLVKQLARKHKEMLDWDEEIAKVEIIFGEVWAATRMWVNHSEIMYTLK